MAGNSRFVRITDNIILEYIYYNQDEIINPGNEWVKDNLNDELWLLRNANDGSVQFFNGDSSKIINPTQGTANVRDYSYTTVNETDGRYALLDIDKIVFYNDFDPNVTDTPDLPIPFVAGPYGIIYDKIRLHLAQNFDFSGFEGFVFDCSVEKQNGEKLYLTRFAYNQSDSYIILNPEPFIFAERFFTSYVEIYIPSLYRLKRDYYLSPLTGDTPTEWLSDFIGWNRDGFLTFSFGWIEQKERIDSQDYISVYRRKIAALPERDPFEVIGTIVQESSIGDFIELYPTYNGDNIDQFITDLNSVNGNDYILIHDIVVSEYLGNGLNTDLTGGTWVITSTQSFSQTDNFDQPIWYRPIIINSESAVAYKIDYTVRFYNRNDNTQFWKRGSLTSFDVRKYGKNFAKIDLGIQSQALQINNQLVENSYELQINNPQITNVQFVTNFVSTNSIAASFSSIPTTNINGEQLTIEEVLENGIAGVSKTFDSFGKTYSNGKLKILISDSGNFVRFVIKDWIESTGALRLKDLTDTPDLRLRFFRTDGSYIEITSYELSSDDRSKGEVSFQVLPEIGKRIKGFRGRNFNIVNIANDNTESVLYTGEFLLQNEYIEWLEQNEITSLNNEITDLNDEILEQTSEIDQLNLNNNQLTEENIALRATIDSLRKQLDEAKSKLEDQKVFTETLSKQFQKVNEEVESLTSNKKKEKETNSTTTKNQVKIKDSKALPFKKNKLL